MMEDTHRSDHDSMLQLELSDDVRVRNSSAQLRRENTKLRKRLERLRVLHSDLPEFNTDRRQMLEAFHQSCSRELILKERVHEEEMKNSCILDALADLRCRRSAHNTRRLTLNNLKQAVFITQCSLEDLRYELMKRDEIIRKRDAEIEELSVLDMNCYLHVKENGARLQDTEEAAHERTLLRAQNKFNNVERKMTPKVRRSRWTDMLAPACSFILTLLFLLAAVSFFVKPPFSSEESCFGYLQNSF